MKVLSFDQATKTGWSFFEDDSLEAFDWKDFGETIDYNYRINEIKNYMIELINKYNPELVCFENVQFQFNKDAYKKISSLQGVLVDYCISNNILFEIVSVNTWRSFHGITGKKKVELKQAAIDKVNSLYDIDVENDDVAEAICIGNYAVNNINIKGV